tara:strand:- start:116 stop:508 length:393 start_codon:yes stop_codon:yes gene_type:complete
LFFGTKLDLFRKFSHLAVMYIFKLFRIEEWLQFKALGKTDGAPIDVIDGFIHFSKANQVKETAAKHFKADKDLILLSCNAENLKPDLKWEISRGGELFPHLYRKLALKDIEARYDIPKVNGLHKFPDIIS